MPVRTLPALLLLAGLTGAAPVTPTRAADHEVWNSAPDQRAILVELFTSEGCSSCPPADALLRQFDGQRAPDGALIVGISEHVTYWNHLGWKDPFSSETYTDRQNAYAGRFRLDSVYTPQMVVNGESQFVGSDSGALGRALGAQNTSDVQISGLNAKSDAGVLDVSFEVKGKLPRTGVELFAVLADDQDQSQVARGENSGRQLVHAAVARSFTRVGQASGAGPQTAKLTLPRSPQPRHLIVFAQEQHSGRVLATATRAL